MPTIFCWSHKWMSQSIVHHDAMEHPHSTHLCVPVLVRVLFFLVVLSEMQFSSAFPINSWHTSPSVLFSLLGEVFGQPTYAFPFHSCVLVSYAKNLHSSWRPHLRLTCIFWHVSYIKFLVFVLGPLWDFLNKTSVEYGCIMAVFTLSLGQSRFRLSL